MKQFNYHFCVEYETYEREIRTNSIDGVCAEWYRFQQIGSPNSMTIMDGYTGEILAHVDSHAESYFTHEWLYILTGYFMLNF